MPEYWFNTTTGEVEEGKQSLAVDRVGPFETAEEAADARQIMQDRAAAWAREEAEEEADR